MPLIYHAATQISSERWVTKRRGITVKLLHVSDLHIGKRVNNIPMLEDQRHILQQLVEIALDRQVSALLIAGDIYDKASPSAEAVALFDAFLSKLAASGLKVIAIPGNHDSSERIAYAQGLLEHQGVFFPPVYDGGSLEHVTLSDEHGDVECWLIPFLKPGDVRRHFPDLEIGDDYSAALTAVLDACEIDTGVRNIALSHQLVTACGIEPERAQDEIKLGGIDNVDVSAYDAFDYVALGHVHRPQRIGRDTVRYSGSPLKYSFSEARYDKSTVLVTLGEKGAGDAVGECVSTELIPLVPLHDMREVSATLEELIASAQDAGDSAGDYLHVTLTDEHPQLDAMRKIQEVFPNAMTVDYELSQALVGVSQPTRVALDPDELSTIDLFASFYEEQTGKPMDEEQKELVSKLVGEIEHTVARGEGE